MTTPARSFQLSRPKTVAERDAIYPPITYEFTGDEPEEGWPLDENGDPEVEVRQVVAHFPGEGVFNVLLGQTGMSEQNEMAIAGSLFTALAKTFDDDDYRFVKAKVESEELELAQLMELIEDMIEQWTAFPTKPSSASTRSQRRTGGRSTGRVPATASTPVASRPSSHTGSAT